MTIQERLDGGILVLDGAMGTMIMREQLDEADFRGTTFADHPTPLKGCNDILTLTRPDTIYAVHKAYLEAGADIISTDTFNANALSLAEYGLTDRVADICRAGASIARKAVDDYCREHDIEAEERPLVAGSMGPTGMSLSISMQESADPAADFDRMAEAYRTQAGALIEGGVDLLLLETIFDSLNAKAATYGIRKAFEDTGREVPLMISATLTETGRMLSGQTLSQFVEALGHARPLSFGLNCGFGAETLIPYIEQLGGLTDAYVSLHPNAGLPDAMGNYLDTPEKMEGELRPLLNEGKVNIIGGCCGTTPDHISRIAKVAKEGKPRKRPAHTVPSAKDRKFTKVGERCNVAGSRKFLRLVAEKAWGECVDIALGQIEKGAGMLDINMDDAMLDAGAAMTTFICRLNGNPVTVAVPLMIDSSDFSVITRALRSLPIKGAVNSISLKNGEDEFLARAREIDAMGCAMVVMAFDEQGQADTFERRIEICARAYRLLTEKGGIAPENIIFDPNVLAVATGIEAHDRYALDFIRATEWITANLPGSHVSGGVSNLSFAFRGIDPLRKAMHTLFLSENIARGMDMAIINPSTPLTPEKIDPAMRQVVEDVILYRSPVAPSALTEFALELKKRLDAEKAARAGAPKPQAPKTQQTEETPCTRLSQRLLDGDTTGLEGLVNAALDECGGDAMAVVDRALMPGMDRVGQLFGRGEIFLPQVVRSASVMKAAVTILTPHIEKAKTGDTSGVNSSQRTIVLATVKGDVHDIGKNIVAVVMSCSGFNVIDLGVMVEPERILAAAREHDAAAIGVSGLITPSLQEMGRVATMMEETGMVIPLFVGGATTSDLHTAVKLAPAYHGAVVHTTDAATLPGAVNAFTDPTTRAEATANLKERQQRLREEYQTAANALPLERARELGSKVDSPAPRPRQLGEFIFHVPLKELEPLINWRAFLHEWSLDSTRAPEATTAATSDAISEESRLIADARNLLASLEGTATAKVVIMPAHGEGDDIFIEYNNNTIKIPTIRQLSPNPVSGRTLALSDFINTEGDHLGFFAGTLAGSGVPEQIAHLKESDEYRSLLLQSLSHRLAEAATEWLHTRVRAEEWGLDPKDGIRPAVGYPSLPDQSLVHLLDGVLHYDKMGIEVTEHGALSPSATTTGLIIGHPASRYFDTGYLTPEAKADYARRRGLAASHPFLS